MADEQKSKPKLEPTPKLLLGLIKATRMDQETDREMVNLLKERIARNEGQMRTFQQQQRSLIEDNIGIVRRLDTEFNRNTRTLIYLTLFLGLEIISGGRLIDYLSGVGSDIVGTVFLAQVIMLLLAGVIALRVTKDEPGRRK